MFLMHRLGKKMAMMAGQEANGSRLKMLNRQDNGEDGKTKNTKVGLKVLILYNNN